MENFFQQVQALEISGDMTLTIKKGLQDQMIVSILLSNRQCSDEAAKLIPPMIVKGTPEELDADFFEVIAAPLQTTSGIIADMATYQQQQEEAKKRSAGEKAKAEAEKKIVDAKEKKYRDGMQQVDQLEQEGRPRDAWKAVPDPAEHPQHRETIQKRRRELAAKFQPDLFGAEATQLTQIVNPSNEE